MNLKITSQTVSVAGREITFDLPADPEEMLEHALEGEAAGSNNLDPYWGLLWADAPKTAELLLGYRWQPGIRSMEVGCGVGLTGIAGLLAGLHVTFADHSPHAVAMAQANASRNGFPQAAGLVFDWREPPTEQFEFIFGSDILYDASVHEPLLQTFDNMLSSEGHVWIGEAGRTNAPLFVEKAVKANWKVELRSDTNQILQNPKHLQFRLIVLSR